MVQKYIIVFFYKSKTVQRKDENVQFSGKLKMES